MNVADFEKKYSKEAEGAELSSNERLMEFQTYLTNELLKEILGLSDDQIDEFWDDDDFLDVVLDVTRVDRVNSKDIVKVNTTKLKKLEAIVNKLK